MIEDDLEIHIFFKWMKYQKKKIFEIICRPLATGSYATYKIRIQKNIEFFDFIHSNRLQAKNTYVQFKKFSQPYNFQTVTLMRSKKKKKK